MSEQNANVEMETSHLEKARNFLSLAKFDATDLCKQTQGLVFSDSLLSAEDFHLVELNSELAKGIKAGDSLTLRGEPGDVPVLCTSSKSYQIKEAQMSNSLLLLPECSLKDKQEKSESGPTNLISREVIAITSHYLELRAVSRFNVGRLRAMLEECPFAGETKEGGRLHGKKYTFAQLLNKVQGSEDEISKALEILPVSQIDGCWRWLDYDYRAQILSDITDFCDNVGADGWKQMNGIQLKTVVGEPEPVLLKMLQLYGFQIDENSWKLDESRTCRAFAEVLLRPTKQFDFDDFLKVWEQCVPIGMKIDLAFLKGLAIIEESVVRKSVKYFPEDSLPEEPQDRIILLFKERVKWRYEDLEPYLLPLVGSPLQVGALLTKFCRCSKIGSVRWYNAR